MYHPDSIVIIGGGLAGDTATAVLRESGFCGALHLVSDESHLPYDRPPLSKAALLQPENVKNLHFRTPVWYIENQVDLILNDGAVSIDSGRREVTLHSGKTLSYGKLLIATGTKARRLKLPGASGAPLFYLRSLQDCEMLRPMLTAGAKIAIIGAGVIGMEVAATANTLGCNVSVIELADRVMARSVSPSVSSFIANYHRRRGVEILTGVKIAAMHHAHGRISIDLEAGPTLTPDAVIVGVGAEPVTDLARQAGLLVEDGIVIDRFTRTSDPDIHAAGDVACFESVIAGRHIRAEHWRHAIDQATTAAHAMLGEPVHYEERPWVWSDQYDLNIQITGEGYGETEIFRGNPADHAFTAFQFRAGRLTGAISVNQAKLRRQIAQLVVARMAIDPAVLADPETDLKKIATVN